ncbi:MAG TPA: hypothetical protein VF413_08655 [Cellulomonas sp.]
MTLACSYARGRYGEGLLSGWLAHPTAGPRRLARLQPASGGIVDMLFDPQDAATARAIRLVRLSRFPGVPIREVDIADLADEAHAHRTDRRPPAEATRRGRPAARPRAGVLG